MSRRKKNQFKPDYAVLPGDTLKESIDALGMSQADLAERTGRPKKTINEIIQGKAAITPETALQLEKVLGVPANFWNNLQRNYEESLARINEQNSLEKHVFWLKKIPVAALIKNGWIKKHNDEVQQLREVLSYFGVATPASWEDRWMGDAQVAFRKSKSFKSDPGSVSSWLRMGEIVAQKTKCQPYDANKFKEALNTIRALTKEFPEVFEPEMKRLCAEAGVVIVFAKELPKMRTSGATWWFNSDKAVIQLSLRYKSNDQLWFSFFHEAGHILKHGKKEFFIEDSIVSEKEKEADEFAANFLIPKNQLENFLRTTALLSKTAIINFAKRLNIASGIVVGRLQHDGKLPYTYCNDLKLGLKWKDAA
jgi:addiction module HigA family antidote